MTVSAAPGGLAGAPAAVGMPSLMAAQGLGRAVSGGDRRAAGRRQIIFSFERRWASSKGRFAGGDNGYAPRLQHHRHHLAATMTCVGLFWICTEAETCALLSAHLYRMRRLFGPLV